MIKIHLLNCNIFESHIEVYIEINGKSAFFKLYLFSISYFLTNLLVNVAKAFFLFKNAQKIITYHTNFEKMVFYKFYEVQTIL